MTSNITRTYENTCPPPERVLKLRGAPASFQVGALTITPVLSEGSSSFGAEIAGVDWSEPVPEEIVRQVGFFPSLNS
jgi:alpha-ketoglutarate-dependent 2,4-dichlorophenoxyacetate dioxygenase